MLLLITLFQGIVDLVPYRPLFYIPPEISLLYMIPLLFFIITPVTAPLLTSPLLPPLSPFLASGR